MKKLLFIPILYLLTLNLSFGQTNTTQKVIEPKQEQPLLFSNIQAQSVSKPASESLYFGYDHKIEEFMLSGTIPNGFPTKTDYSTKELYRNAMNKWISENQDKVRTEFKNKIITE